MVKIAINGMGRIGRNFLRILMLNSEIKKQIEVVAVNIGPADRAAAAHMFKYDTIMGTYPGTVSVEGNYLIIDGKKIILISESDPAKANWGALAIDWVVDCTGAFTDRARAQLHIDAGAKHVLISAPAHDEDVAIVPGVNEERYNSQSDKIVSLGSCTTNALMPTLKVLNDVFGITEGYMTTVHAYTNTQVLLDVEADSDLRRSRAAALNIIPTSTGAAKMVASIMPELKGKIDGMALRVPVAKVSLMDFAFTAQKKITREAINEAFIAAGNGCMKGILGFTNEPLVSSDFSGIQYSVVIDGLLTATVGSLGKVYGWYDNEWGYCERLKDFLVYVSKK